MKTNNEKVLRYLAGLMDKNERMIFEDELLKSAELKEKLTEARERLMKLKVDVGEEPGERYFNNLLPRVRRKIEKKSKSRFAEKIYYLVPYGAAAVIGLLFLFKPAHKFDYEYKDLAGKVVNNMMDKDIATKYFDEFDTEPVYLETSNNDNSLVALIPSNLDVNNDAASKILTGTVLDEYGTLYDYSDDQLKTIAANLDKLNIK